MLLWHSGEINSKSEAFNYLLSLIIIIAESLNADHKEETTLLHLCVTKLNHMRSEQKYFKLLNSWAKELAITGKVLKVGDHRGIYAVLIGPEEALAVFLKKWKACKVDIDSHGRPCKEKLISVLCQQQIAIASHRRRMRLVVLSGLLYCSIQTHDIVVLKYTFFFYKWTCNK